MNDMKFAFLAMFYHGILCPSHTREKKNETTAQTGVFQFWNLILDILLVKPKWKRGETPGRSRQGEQERTDAKILYKEQ